MTEWRESKLGDVITLKRGYDLPQQRRKTGPFPIVSSSGVTDHHIEAKVKGPGVVTGRYGTLGEVFYIQGDFWPLNTSLYVQDFKGNDPRFISFFLRQLNFGTKNAAGAVPGVNRNHLHAMDVRIPSLPVQRRIAGILSAYDELIENNQRRIKILEEMARSLYREWFVHFRFPGHDKVKMVPSPLGPIPQGWEVKKLGEVLELNYGKALKSDTRREGQIPVFGSSGIVGSHDTSLVKGPGIIVGRKGNVGSVFWSDADFYPIDTAYFVTSSLPLRFMFYELQTKNFINNDAAVPGLSRHQAYSLETVIPPTDLLTRFCRLADDFDQQASKLRHQIENLRRTRDLLLPRLLSGQNSLEVGSG
jgi:type I restriction enzyme S subunit